MSSIFSTDFLKKQKDIQDQIDTHRKQIDELFTQKENDALKACDAIEIYRKKRENGDSSDQAYYDCADGIYCESIYTLEEKEKQVKYHLECVKRIQYEIYEMKEMMRRRMTF